MHKILLTVCHPGTAACYENQVPGRGKETRDDDPSPGYGPGTAACGRAVRPA